MIKKVNIVKLFIWSCLFVSINDAYNNIAINYKNCYRKSATKNGGN